VTKKQKDKKENIECPEGGLDVFPLNYTDEYCQDYF